MVLLLRGVGGPGVSAEWPALPLPVRRQPVLPGYELLVVVGLVYQFRLQNALGRAENNSREMLKAWDAPIEVAERNAHSADEEELLHLREAAASLRTSAGLGGRTRPRRYQGSRSIAQGDLGHPSVRDALGRDYAVLATICQQTARPSEAEAAARKGVELMEPLLHNPSRPRDTVVILAENLLSLGNLQRENHQPEEGIVTLTRCVNLLEELLRQDAADAHVRILLRGAYAARAQARNDRGEMFKAAGDLLRFRALEKPPPSGKGK